MMFLFPAKDHKWPALVTILFFLAFQNLPKKMCVIVLIDNWCCPMANFRQLSSGQPHLRNIDHCVSIEFLILM